MLSLSKPASLVQQKKQQWAREREEMSHLYLPWGGGSRCPNPQTCNQFTSSLELHHPQYESQEPLRRQRSPSLPPIQQAAGSAGGGGARRDIDRNISPSKRFAFYDEDGEGDTSGYGSETINHRRPSGNFYDINTNVDPIMAWQQTADTSDRRRPNSSDGDSRKDCRFSSRSPQNIHEEGRPKWGDRGVATGRLWEPNTPNDRLPQMAIQKKGTPAWVERGLNMIEHSSEVMVIDQSSTNSAIDCDRSSCNGSEEGRSFLRGQNVPIEPEVKALRESKRIKALELQTAILSQLEDREKQRQAERDRKLREEKIEEMRILKQQEEDRLRLEEEQRKCHERQMLEQKKLDTLKKALDDAEKKARQDKEKRFYSMKQNENVTATENVASRDKMSEPNEKSDEEAANYNFSQSPTKTNRTYDDHSSKSRISVQKDIPNLSHQTSISNSPRVSMPDNRNVFIHNVPPLCLGNNQFSIVPIGTNYDTMHNGVQLAVLVPQNFSNNLYNATQNSFINNEMSESGKIITPSNYRSNLNKDAFTQTEVGSFAIKIDKANETESRNIYKYYSNIDENAPEDHHHSKKERRYRSEERYKKDLDSRPKWGVNRPVAQYKKQSEKDPFFGQKRKLRQKYRTQPRQYLSQSSDDSRSPSPPTRSDVMDDNNKSRSTLSQSYWKSKSTINDASKTTDLMDNETLSEANLKSLTISEDNAQCKKSPVNAKSSTMKRLTLSQKFINDKYGNRKLWMDDVSIKNNNTEFENRKKTPLDGINTSKRDFVDRHEVTY